jgi:hypothetical protein
MAIARITGTGLGAIAALVVVLWACVVGEHWIVARANRDLSRTMLEVRKLQNLKRLQPAATPSPTVRRQAKPALG